ncbi:MAG: hypothetical protein ABIQ88_04300 [Chitinophagaceae bacterium]
MKRLCMLAFGCSLLWLLSNCQKADPGPAGATGAAGAAGPTEICYYSGVVAGGRLSGEGMNDDTFVFADGSTMRKSELDKMSYEDVCSKFNIPRY